MHPAHDVDHAEARRAERAERLDRPFGREISQRSRRIGQWVVVVVAIAILVAIVVGWVAVAIAPR
jgi:hypothetical protein